MTAIRSAERTTFLADIVIGVAEDFGTNPWRQVVSYKHTPENEAYVTIVDVEDEDEPQFKLDIEAAASGVAKLLSKDFGVNSTIRESVYQADRENDAGYIDAYDADCILQAAWFGELVYG